MISRIFLHAVCTVRRPRTWHFHAAGIYRELYPLAHWWLTR